MIKIKYHYTDDFRLKGFTLKGHAEYAEYGYDIVCSAVTSNAIGGQLIEFTSKSRI